MVLTDAVGEIAATGLFFLVWLRSISDAYTPAVLIRVMANNDKINLNIRFNFLSYFAAAADNLEADSLDSEAPPTGGDTVTGFF